MDAFWIPVMLGGLISGASTGVLGVYIVGMRIPFLGICVSHAALAGAVLGSLAGMNGPWLLLPALAGAVLAALVLGMIDPHRMRVDTNTVLAVLFTLTMGLTFLGIGLMRNRGKSDNDILGLLWGSLLFCGWREVVLMLAAALALLIFIIACYKEMRAIMFDRQQAAAAGVHVGLVWTIFLILVSVVLTVNFQTVGGLMIYSLIVCPAAATFQLVKGYGRSLLLAACLGGISGLGGFLIAYQTNLPTGAIIVILASLIAALAAIYRRLWSISQS
ncbi:MAG: metal ABC transporter permease [Phycisphaerales bacterium]|nr:metal ABC transporter permease [Phycisphaerales bacterium]